MNSSITLKNHFLLLLFILPTGIFLSQKQNFKSDYTLSSCSGKVPSDFLINTLDKINEDVDGNKKAISFYEQFRFSQQKILFGGKVLFGDEMSIYVNKVAHNLLDKSGNSKLKKELRFYVLKTDVVNAICMPDGAVFVTVGLLSQIENEAQLAYIISHEIAHYTKQHSVNDYYKEEKITSKYKSEGLTYKEALKTLSNYSKENELESDKVGFSMFKKAGYNTEEAINSLIVLQYSHLPFDEVKFDKEFFNRENYTIPPTHFSTKTQTEEIEDNSAKDDTYSTHPNIKTRIDNLDAEEMKSGVTAFFSDDEFNYINTKARFENQYLHLLEKSFIKVIYESYLLKKKYPENSFLDKCIAQGVYGLSKFKTNTSFYNDYKEKFYGGSSSKTFVEGESLVLYEMFENMDEKELNILALKLFNELKGKENEAFIEDLMYDLIKENKFDYNTFHTSKQLNTIEDDEVIEFIDTNNDTTFAKVVEEDEFIEIDSLSYLKLTKVEKIEYSLKKKEYLVKQGEEVIEYSIDETADDEEENTYYLSAFVNEMTDTSFYNSFQKVIEDSTYRYYSNWYNDMGYEERSRFNRKKKRRNYNKASVNIDSLIIVEPYYHRSDGRKKYEVFIEESLEHKNEWSKSLQQSIETHDKEVINLAYTHSDSVTLDKIKIQFLLKEWHNEMIENSNYHLLPFSQERTTNLIDSLGYNNILISGLVNERVKSNPTILLGVIVYPLAPLFVIWYLKPKYETYKYISIIDKNGYLVLSKYFYTKSNSNVFHDRLFIEDIMNQISKK